MEDNAITPFDTGKVKIGLLYKVQPPSSMDGNDDADYLQEALLHKTESSWIDKAREIARKIVGL